jgi:transcriptional regulator with XRE-family HTH domain
VSNLANDYESMKRLGEKLRTLREQRGFSLQQLGNMLEVSKTYVWEMEKGQKMPNIAMLVKICDVFGVASDVLIRDDLELED